jgi:hypothetical protein
MSSCQFFWIVTVLTLRPASLPSGLLALKIR